MSKSAERIIARSECVVSAASLWEMTIKNDAGKLPLPAGSISGQLEEQGFRLLAVLPRHVDAARGLTFAHPDPFDRLLIAQARDEGLTLLTKDTELIHLGLDNVQEG